MSAELLHQNKIAAVRKKSNNLISQQLVDMALTQALLFTPRETGAWPSTDFDLEYFTEVMVNLFKTENQKTIRAVLDGEDLRWFDEEDFK